MDRADLLHPLEKSNAFLLARYRKENASCAYFTHSAPDTGPIRRTQAQFHKDLLQGWAGDVL